jgi:hypothetical protein
MVDSTVNATSRAEVEGFPKESIFCKVNQIPSKMQDFLEKALNNDTASP